MAKAALISPPSTSVFTVFCGCVYQESKSERLMMKSAQDSVRTYDAGSLNRTRNRRIFVQGSMRSDAVVIIGVRFQNPAQMLLAEDDEVIQTLTPDRSDQPFGKAILPR